MSITAPGGTSGGDATLPDDRFTRAWSETEAGSWFLGLWTADGYLSRDASMSLALKDHDAVRLAAVALGLNADRVGMHRKLGQARIRVGVKWFLPRLAAIGIAPGPKTGGEQAPLGLEHNRHFWRGVVDGDGWVCPERRVIGLVPASPVPRDQFRDFLSTAIGCAPTMSARNEGTLHQMTLTGSNAAVLSSLLYTGSTFALPRKRDAALLVVQGECSVRMRAAQAEARNQRIVAAYADGRSGHEIAALEAVSADTVYYVPRRAGVTDVHGIGMRRRKSTAAKVIRSTSAIPGSSGTAHADAELVPETADVPGPSRRRAEHDHG